MLGSRMGLFLVVVSVLFTCGLCFFHKPNYHQRLLRKAPTEDVKRNINRVSYKECNLDPGERLDCGGRGTKEEDCYRRECCWGESEEPGVPWCYHSIPTMKKSCLMDESLKDECGWVGIRKEQCLAKNCCWQPSGQRGSPWCFTHKQIPVYTGECGKTAIRPITMSRVIGGIEAIPNSWPWMASLQIDQEHMCGGSIINHRWILSAAHCQDALYGGVAVLGAHSVVPDEDTDTKVTVNIDKMFRHEEYATMEPLDDKYGGVYADVLLIRLEHPIEFNDYISPLCLASEPPRAERHCYSMGWGLSELTFNEDDGMPVVSVPEKLQQFMSPVVDTDKCNSTGWYDGRINPTSMCAGYEEGGRGNCFGDSGGPLVCKENGLWHQVGIVSWGEPCALARFPTVYAEVSQFVEWIELKLASED